jgi:hypothetical protein
MRVRARVREGTLHGMQGVDNHHHTNSTLSAYLATLTLTWPRGASCLTSRSQGGQLQGHRAGVGRLALCDRSSPLKPRIEECER